MKNVGHQKKKTVGNQDVLVNKDFQCMNKKALGQ